MFNSFKKWVKNEELQQRGTPPTGMQTMKTDLQRKFAKGVQYNLRIVIRGDRNTGKTCLLHRLQGQKFLEEYIPTAEIQVASIHWNYKATDDVVKVDVWDIVDEGRNKKKPSKGLKLDSNADGDKDMMGEQVLDASFLDVYKGAHAVIMIFDITKKWTFSYIERELPKVPSYLPVLILANFRDMGHHRVIETDEVGALVESLDRSAGSPSILFFESSMKNGYGLKFIHKFINMPFLLVQRESLLKQLETNHLDLESCVEELASEDHTYKQFLQMVQERREGKTPQSPTQAQPDNNKIPNVEKSNAPPSTQRVRKPTPPKTLDPGVSEVKAATKNDQQNSGAGLFSPSQMEEQTPTSAPVEQEKKGFMSRFFRRSSTPDSTQAPQNKPSNPDPTRVQSNQRAAQPVTNVEEFVPDEGGVDDFLNEIPDSVEKSQTNMLDSSDDEENGGNPMVAGFQEDIDSDDQVAPSYGVRRYSSSESDEGDFKDSKKSVTSEKKTKTQTHKVDSLNTHKSTKTSKVTKDVNLQSSEEEFASHEIIQDADDLSSDGDTYSKNYAKFNEMITSNTTPPKGDVSPQITSAEPQYTTSNNDHMTQDKSPALQRVNQLEKSTVSEESDEDETVNVMVSTAYDDVSSNEEITPVATVSKQPIAIVTPLQAERKVSWKDEDSNGIKEKQGLNLELDAADLDFLEQRTKVSETPSPTSSEPRGSSKEVKGHRSKKSSRSSEDASSRHKHKHKKHRSKDVDDERNTNVEQSRSHRSSKEDKERRKKKKSRSTKEPRKDEDDQANKDLEAFLGGKSYEAL